MSRSPAGTRLSHGSAELKGSESLRDPARTSGANELGSARLNDVDCCAVSKTRQVTFTVFPGKATFSYVGKPEPARNVADRLKIVVVEFAIHHGVLCPIHQFRACHAVLKVTAKLGRHNVSRLSPLITSWLLVAKIEWIFVVDFS